MRSLAARIFAVLLAATLAGCGFHLRGSGSATLPYKTMHIALPNQAEVNIWLQRYILASGTTQIVSDPKEAEAVFEQISETRQKTILSVNSLGLVREYRLVLIYTFRIVNAQGKELVPANEISLYRDMSYNDSGVQAKNIEEALLWRDLTNDLVNQIMRRLATVKPRDPSAAEEE